MNPFISRYLSYGQNFLKSYKIINEKNKKTGLDPGRE